MLMPDVARNQASGNRASIAHTISRTIRFCPLSGAFSPWASFSFSETPWEPSLFQSTEVGVFLRILSFLLCPFLYLDATLASILTGLGCTRLVFLQNIAGHSIRIAFVWFAVPLQGIKGYLTGILVSEILTTFLRLTALYRKIPFTFRAVPDLLLPAGAMAAAAGCTLLLSHFLARFLSRPLYRYFWKQGQPPVST